MKNIQSYICALCLIMATQMMAAQQAAEIDQQNFELNKSPEVQVVLDSVALSFGQSISIEDLTRHLSTLASDEFEGRGTGQEGQKKAANYIANHFKALDFKAVGDDNGYFQKINLSEKSWGDMNITVKGKEYEFLKDFYCFPRTTDEIEAAMDEVVFLGYGIDDPAYSDYAGKNVAGKTVVVLNGEPKQNNGDFYVSGNQTSSKWSSNWRLKLETAKKNGVKLLLIITEKVPAKARMMSPYINTKAMELEIPNTDKRYADCVYISEAMAQNILGTGRKMRLSFLQNKINKKGKPRMATTNSADLKLSLTKKGNVTETENVVGYLEGTDLKDELVIITAHYDHLGIDGDKIYNGADDDGSGTTALLEIAEAFSLAAKEGNGPRRSMLFMTVTAEEKGLLGSKYYTDIAPIFPLENTVVDLNIDMVGRTDEKYGDDGKYVYVIGSDKLSSELHEISEQTNKLYTKLKMDYVYNSDDDPNRFYYRSDHYNFAKNNIPIIFYFNGSHEDYHQETDTVDKIRFDALQGRAQLVFYTAWQIANKDTRLVVDKAE